MHLHSSFLLCGPDLEHPVEVQFLERRGLISDRESRGRESSLGLSMEMRGTGGYPNLTAAGLIPM